MAGGAAGHQQKIRDFVSRLFQGNPDLSILTHGIIRKKYLDHAGLKTLSRQEKDLLKQLVEEELIQMKVDQPPSNVKIKTEPQDSFKSEDHKRPLHISHSSEDEIKNEKKPKRQKIEKKLETSSDEKDSGIDSKKRPWQWGPKLLRISDSSGQEDSRAGNHSIESESDEAITRSKRKPSFQAARRESGQGRKSPKGQRVRGSQKRRVSESEETDTEQSDLEEEVKECRKVTKGNSLKQRAKEKVDKGSNDNGPKGKAKKRAMNKQRDKKDLSEEGTDQSSADEISEKKRESSESESEEKKSFSANKAQRRARPGTQKDSKGNEGEDASGTGPDEKVNPQKTMTDRQCRRRSRVIEDSGSSSEDSPNQSPVRKEGAKGASGESGSRQTGKHSKPEGQPKAGEERKKGQREGLCRRKQEEVKKGTLGSTSEESGSESGERKSSEEKKKRVRDSSSNKGEPESEVNQGQPEKAALISSPSESESDEDQRRTLEKESKHVSESDSSQGEKKLKKRRAQKSQRKSLGQEISRHSSEDSGNEYKGKEKIQSQEERRTKKPQRRSATKEKQGEESSQEEGSSSEEDKPTTSQQHHPRKDKKQHSGKNKDSPFVQRLKRYIRECGVRQNYKKLLAGCHSHKAQIEALKKELGSIGIKGTPSLAKCKALKQEREVAAEMASLDISNIIPTEGRPKRHNVWSLYNRPRESPSLPEEPIVRRRPTDRSQLQRVISSDTESS